MQRIFNLTKWTRIPDGSALAFHGDRPRRVDLEVNTPGRAVLSLIEGGVPHFLAQVNGRDSVQFHVTGPFKITATGADTYIYTADGNGVELHKLDSESYAVVREKRARNPELEYIAAVMAENVNRRLAQQSHELEGLRRALSRRSGLSGEVASGDGAAVGAEPELDASAEGEPGGAEASAETGQRARGRPRRSG